MDTKDIAGAQLAVGFLAAYIDHGGTTTFWLWAQTAQPQRWKEFATAQGRAEDDQVLAVDALLALQAAVLDASRLHLDRMIAVMQARELTGQ